MKIQLPELDVISCNGSWTGLILKKHLTFDEARFIAASALGVNMDLLLDDWWARSIVYMEKLQVILIMLARNVQSIRMKPYS